MTKIHGIKEVTIVYWINGIKKVKIIPESFAQFEVAFLRANRCSGIKIIKGKTNKGDKYD